MAFKRWWEKPKVSPFTTILGGNYYGTEGSRFNKTSDSCRQSNSGTTCWSGTRSARCKHYVIHKGIHERTKNDAGLIIPVVITVYEDRSFTFVTKTPPAAVLIKKACGIDKASGVPNKNKVATISKADVQKIAETKMPDLNAANLEAAMSMIAGTARSMGIVVED